MTVKFFSRGDHGVQVEGTITMKDGVLVADPPDSLTLHNVLNDNVRIDCGEDPPLVFNAIHHPKEFLEALPKQYHGSYFWCKQVED